MSHRLNRPVLISAAVIIILLLILTAIEPNALRTMLAVPLVLLVPGFALTVSLFEWNRLGIPERILLSVGLSVAITALLGLLLNWTPWGLRTSTLWNALLLVITLEVAVIVFVRRLRWTEIVRLPVGLNFTARQWVLMGLAAFVTIMAIQVARTPTSQQGLEGYTVLWVQPSEMPNAIRLGVNSEEFETTEYQIQFEINDIVREGQTLKLHPGETWEGVFRLPSNYIAGNPLTVFLYRLNHPNEVYRHVVWWPESE